MPKRVRVGVDYVFLSLYETACDPVQQPAAKPPCGPSHEDMVAIVDLFNKGAYAGRISAFFSMDGSAPQRLVDRGTGSNRYAHELNLPGLKFWPLTRYPYLVFYVERPDRIDVWRVLHGQRDIPAWMQEAAGS